MKPLPLQEREYREGLYRLERRAIIPLKWGMLAVTIVLWTWLIGKFPETPVFILFLFYGLATLAQSYFFYFSTVTSQQVKPFALFSYLVDVVFVSMIIYFDLATPYFGVEPHHNFYLIYFLLVMRGFGLFKTLVETVFVNFLISILYMITWYLSGQHFEKNLVVSLILIWLVIIMAWLIIIVITKQKMELMEVNERLLRADSLSRVGELAAGIAHEINNPIGIIATTSEYLKMRTTPGDDRLEDIEAIHTEALRCKEIVQQMLTYANPRPVGLAPVDARAINDEVLFFAFPKTRHAPVEVIREYDSEAPVMEADPNLLKQALLNLYINARQAIPEGRPGRIVSRIEGRDRGRKLAIEIEDNGTGIPEDAIDHIFEPFFTRKSKGTGLGLAITQRIVENFKGAISVRPGSEMGTVFVLEFPAHTWARGEEGRPAKTSGASAN